MDEVADVPGGRVAAVVTAYHPDERLRDVVEAALAQCVRVVVADNTPDTPDDDGGRGAATALAGLVDGDLVRLVADGRNAGLAAALNRGVAAVGDDVDAVLLLDQDSRLPEGLVGGLSVHLARDGVAVAAPAPWDEQADRYLDPRAALRPVVADLPVVITSGMLVRRDVLATVGPFRADFFVDCVDQDFCLRVRAAGGRVVQDRSVHLPHSLGTTRWRGVGPLRLRTTGHPGWRLYWAARNGVVLAREHARAEPRWVATSLALLAYVAVTVALFEPPRGRRLLLMARGARDGWAGRTDGRQVPPGAVVAPADRS